MFAFSGSLLKQGTLQVNRHGGGGGVVGGGEVRLSQRSLPA